jgi:predicted DNA-binding transcriptional regulator AlpA
MTRLEDLVDVPAIADLLGVSRPTAFRYARRDDFPKPATQVGATRLWNRREIERWRKKNPPSKFDRFRRPQR